MILVTGATGFIGRHLVRALAASGWAVRATLRHPSRASALPPGVECVVVGDLAEPVAWESVLRGVGQVVHVAGHAHVQRPFKPADEARFRAVNVSATHQLAAAAVRAGVTRLVYISSVAAIGDETAAGKVWDEEVHCAPQNAYGRSKLEAECLLQDIGRRCGLEVVILRPPSVYGAGLPAGILEFFRLIDRGIPLPFGLVRNRRSFLYVGNLVDCILRVTKAGEAAGQVFHVADGEDLSAADLATRVARVLGRPARLLPMPPGLLLLSGRAGDAVAHALHMRLMVNAESVRGLVAPLWLDSSKVRRLLDWTPPWTVDQGLAMTAEWFKASRAHPSTHA